MGKQNVKSKVPEFGGCLFNNVSIDFLFKHGLLKWVKVENGEE